MNNLDPSATAFFIVQDRIREADHRRLVGEFRSERASTGTATATATETPQRHSRLWSVVHFRHAYS